MYLYLKALHLIFIVTWFSGMFYVVRLFIYNAEAENKPEPERGILHKQFEVMMKRLWYGVTWPSAIITMILGPWLIVNTHSGLPQWLLVKILFVVGLYVYHFILHDIFQQQMDGEYKWTSSQLRIWNEVATLFLVAIVLLVVVKESMSFLWGIIALVTFSVILFGSVFLYRIVRKYRKHK